MSTDTHVTLGEHSYAVYPQKIGYLENRLGKSVETLLTQGIEGTEDVVSALGGAAYNVLRVFIPRLMEEHEFRGYRSAAALEAGDYDPEADASPSFPQIVGAFETVTRVNRFDLFSHLGKLVGPQMREALTALVVARMTEPEPELTGGSSQIESSTTTPPTT
jgi:hypothetical protein